MLFSLNSTINLGGFRAVEISCRPVLMRFLTNTESGSGSLRLSLTALTCHLFLQLLFGSVTCAWLDVIESGTGPKWEITKGEDRNQNSNHGRSSVLTHGAP